MKYKSILILSVLFLVASASASTIVSKVEIWSEYPLLAPLGIGDRLYLVTESDGQKYYEYSASTFLKLGAISYIQSTKNMPFGGFPDGFEGMSVTITPVSCVLTGGASVKHVVIAEYNSKRIGDQVFDDVSCGSSGSISDSIVLKNDWISEAGINLQTSATYSVTVKERLYWGNQDPVRGSTKTFNLVVGSGTTTPTPTPTPTSTTAPTPTPSITPVITPIVTPTPTTSITPGITPGTAPSITPGTTPSIDTEIECYSGYVWSDKYKTCRPIADTISDTVNPSGSNTAYIIIGAGLLAGIYLLKRKDLKW